MDIASVCLHLINPIDVAIGRIQALKRQFRFAEDDLAILFNDFEHTRRQLTNLQSFIERAELTSDGEIKCDQQLNELQVKVNKLEGTIEYLDIKLRNKSGSIFRREKHRINSISGDLERIRHQNNKIDSNIAAIRSEITIEVALAGRIESRTQHTAVKDKLEVIDKNTKLTDAKRIRADYRASALAWVTMEEDIVTTTRRPSTVKGKGAKSPDSEEKIVASHRISQQMHLLISNPKADEATASLYAMPERKRQNSSSNTTPTAQSNSPPQKVELPKIDASMEDFNKYLSESFDFCMHHENITKIQPKVQVEGRTELPS